MPKQPTDALTNMLGQFAERAAKYAQVWQEAAVSNAHNGYSPEQAMAHAQQVFTMALRDMADMGAAMMEAYSSVLTPDDAPAQPAEPAQPRKKAPAKKKAAAKKAPPRRPPR